jgi:hypothetical protein
MFLRAVDRLFWPCTLLAVRYIEGVARGGNMQAHAGGLTRRSLRLRGMLLVMVELTGQFVDVINEWTFRLSK